MEREPGRCATPRVPREASPALNHLDKHVIGRGTRVRSRQTLASRLITRVFFQHLWLQVLALSALVWQLQIIFDLLRLNQIAGEVMEG